MKTTRLYRFLALFLVYFFWATVKGALAQENAQNSCGNQEHFSEIFNQLDQMGIESGKFNSKLPMVKNHLMNFPSCEGEMKGLIERSEKYLANKMKGSTGFRRQATFLRNEINNADPNFPIQKFQSASQLANESGRAAMELLAASYLEQPESRDRRFYLGAWLGCELQQAGFSGDILTQEGQRNRPTISDPSMIPLLETQLSTYSVARCLYTESANGFSEESIKAMIEGAEWGTKTCQSLDGFKDRFKAEAVFDLRNPNNQTPQVSLLKDNPDMAQRVTKALNVENPKVKIADSFDFTISEIRFKLDPENPGQLIVSVMTDLRELVSENSIDLSRLLSGQPIEIKFHLEKKSTGAFGVEKATTTIRAIARLQLDLQTLEISIRGGRISIDVVPAMFYDPARDQQPFEAKAKIR